MEKPFSFFTSIVQYIKEIAPQIALGGGEPFLFPGFIRDLGMACKKHDVMLNITTNGSTIAGTSGNALSSMLETVTMVSISLDRAKWHDMNGYAFAARGLRSAVPGLLVGTNLLLEGGLFTGGAKRLYTTIEWCLNVAMVDRVFLLYPKNFRLGVDVLEFKTLLQAISTVFPGRVFVDDLTRQILEHGYPPWDVPCHFGRDMISIDERGGVHGCSFDAEPVVMLETPPDILNVRNIDFENRVTCPYLVVDRVD